MAQRPVTLKDIVAGHVSLDIEAFDRIYLSLLFNLPGLFGRGGSFLSGLSL